MNLMELTLLTLFRHSKIDTFYCIENALLDKVEAILDLGILLDHRLNYRDNISMIVSKAYAILLYMKGCSKEFVEYCIKEMLFISLVRPILEYDSIIWNPCYAAHINSIESVQK